MKIKRGFFMPKNGSAGNYVGKDVDDKYKLFPIPQDEFTVNPNLAQNPNFK